MTLEAKYPIVGDSMIYKEPFLSEFDVLQNGGVNTGVAVFNGVATLNAGTDNINYGDLTRYRDMWSGGASFRFKGNINNDGGGSSGRIASKAKWEMILSEESASTGKLTFSQVFSGDNGGWKTDDRVIPFDQDVEIVITYDSSSASNNPIFYINGTAYSVGSGLTETSTPTGTPTTDAGSNFLLGNRSALNRGYNGTMNLIEFRNKILTASEVSNLYNNIQYSGLVSNGLVFNMDARTGAFSDKISGTVPTNNGDVLVKKTKKGRAAWFDGSADLNFGNIADIAAEDATVVAFFRMAKEDSTFRRILDKRNGNDEGYIMDLNTVGELRGFIEDDAANTGAINGGARADDGNWHMGLYTINRTTDLLEVFLDNVSLGTADISSVGSLTNTNSLILADSTAGNLDMMGFLPVVRIYNRVLTDEEIAQTYQEFLSSF